MRALSPTQIRTLAPMYDTTIRGVRLMKFARPVSFGIGLVLAQGLAYAEAAPPQHPVEFDVPAQSLSSALNVFAKQSDLRVAFYADVTERMESAAVHGTLTPEKALNILLSGANLTYEFADDNSVLIWSAKQAAARGGDSQIHLAQASGNGKTDSASASPSRNSPESTAPGTPSTASASRNPDASEDVNGVPLSKIEQVVVTGTLIRGAGPTGSPISIYTRDDIKRSGAATLGAFARNMTENFASIDASTTGTISAGGTSQNASALPGSAAFNLRGLGVGATLTLIDGHKVAPGGMDGSFVDISMIPLAATERIEVMPDGASAIYGADAMAGIVNVILRRDFDGAESSLHYSTTTRGSGADKKASQLLGHSWSGGNAMVAYEYSRNEGLDANERDFIPSPGGPLLIVPEMEQHSVFLNARQRLSETTAVFGNLNYSRRAVSQDSTAGGALTSHVNSRSRQYGGYLALEQELPRGWQATVELTHSRNSQPISSIFPLGVPSDQETITDAAYDTRLSDFNLRADGSLVELPGGELKLAVGGGRREDRFASHNVISFSGLSFPAGAPIDAGRSINSAYLEFLVPIVGPANSITSTRSLTMSVAARYDDYSDFGGAVSPKVGISWVPFEGLEWRASYGRSFRPPLLTQLNGANSFYTFPIANPADPSGVTNTLLNVSSANSTLQPEYSRSFTTGLDFTPQGVPNLLLRATYYKINYEDRIAPPPIDSLYTIYSNLAVLAPFINRSPSLSEVQAAFADPGFAGDFAGGGPGAVQAIFDNRLQNLSTSLQTGVDASVNYSHRTDHLGTMRSFVAGTYVLSNKFRTVEAAPETALLNLVGQPLKFRMRGGLSWERAGFNASLNANYWNSYSNTIITPSTDVASWTTVDAQIGYTVSTSAGLLDGVAMTFSVLNIADHAPPFVEEPASLGLAVTLNYDAQNANPFGRTLAFNVQKRW